MADGGRENLGNKGQNTFMGFGWNQVFGICLHPFMSDFGTPWDIARGGSNYLLQYPED